MQPFYITVTLGILCPLLVGCIACFSSGTSPESGEDLVPEGPSQAVVREGPDPLALESDTWSTSGRFESLAPREIALCRDNWLDPKDVGSLQRRLNSYLTHSTSSIECAQWILWTSDGNEVNAVGVSLASMIIGLALFPDRYDRSTEILNILAGSGGLDRPLASEWIRELAGKQLETEPIG